MYAEGTLITWENFNDKYNLQKKDFFKWRHLVAAIGKLKLLKTPNQLLRHHHNTSNSCLAAFQSKI